MTATTLSNGAARLLGSLLPECWPARAELLQAAASLDAEHPTDASDQLLEAWRTFATSGVLPASPGLRDLVAALVELLGGVGAELRHQPRQPAPAHRVTSANDTRTP